MEFLEQIVNFDAVLRASFTVEQNAPYQGWSAYTTSTWIALFVNEDGPRVDVYNEEGETLFSQQLSEDLPVRVAAAWVREALEVRP